MRWKGESAQSLEEWEVAILVTGKQEGWIGSSLRMFQIANCFRLKHDKYSFRHVQKLQCYPARDATTLDTILVKF